MNVLGIDLAWGEGRDDHAPNETGVVAVDRSGRILDAGWTIGVAATAHAATFRIDGTIDMPTGPGGAVEPNPTSDAEWLWLWEDVAAASSYRFDFKALIGHMSLDNLVVYASPPRDPPPPPPVPTQRAARVMGNALAAQLAATAEALNPR